MSADTVVAACAIVVTFLLGLPSALSTLITLSNARRLSRESKDQRTDKLDRFAKYTSAAMWNDAAVHNSLVAQLRKSFPDKEMKGE